MTKLNVTKRMHKFVVSLMLIGSISFTIKGATEKLYENPDYAVSMTPNLFPTRVERTQDATRISFHCKYPSGNWIKVDTTAFLVVPDSDIRLSPIAAEGLILNEGFQMPENGETDFTVIYPSLPDNVREVDYIDGSWKILGIRLDGSKSEGKTVIDIDRWEKEHYKPYPGVPEKFFNPGEAIISGVINGYHPRSGVDNMLVYHSNPVTSASVPYFTPIASDGTFSVAVPMECPGYVSPAGFLNQWQWYYAEPGRTLEIVLDWDDMMRSEYDKRMYRIFRNPEARFGGDVGEINAELAGAPLPTDSHYREWASKTVPSEAADRIAEIFKKDSIALERYISDNGISDHSARILRHNLIGNYIDNMMLYERELDYLQYDDPDAPALKEPLTSNFFSFLNDVFRDDDIWFLANRWMNSVPNRLAFSLVMNDDIGAGQVYRYEFMDPGFAFLRSKGVSLTSEEEEIEKTLNSKIGTSEIVDAKGLEKFWNMFNGTVKTIAARNGLESELDSLWKDLDRNTKSNFYDAIPENMRIWANNIKQFCGSNNVPILGQVALTGALCSYGVLNKEVYAYSEVKDILEEIKLSDVIPNQEIFAIMERYFSDWYENNRETLPDDERGHVVRDIIAPYKGKMILLDLWATWCSPCRWNIEQSAEERITLRENPDFKMIFITSESDSPIDVYNDYVSKNLSEEESLRIPGDDFNRIRDLFHFNAIPHYVLIGRNGEILTPDFKYPHHGSLIDSLKFYGL